MNPTVLVVDDSEEVRKVLKRSLEREAFVVLATDSAAEAMLLVREARPDVILTDIHMPGLDGRAFCNMLKKNPATRSIPVIMMSGIDVREPDALKGYASGAADYVTKPVSPPLLLAKIKAVLQNRRQGKPPDEAIRRAGIALSFSARSAQAAGKPLDLSPKEFDLLAALLQNTGRVLSATYLLETVWRYDPAEYNDPHSVEVHVSRLRKKLGPRLGKLIINVVGHGYKFES